MDILSQVDHRPWPLPERSPFMTQTWHDLLFAHWPVSAEELCAALPPGIEPDLFMGQAWLGLVVFRLTGVRLLGLPEVPVVSHFSEVNVRTYVKVGDKAGVYFLCLDTDNWPTVWLARPWFRLAYHHARIKVGNRGLRTQFRSRRDERNSSPAQLTVTYSPCGPPHLSCQGSLERWLTERYRYYSTTRDGKVCHCDIHHGSWRLQPAEAYIQANTMALSHGIILPRAEPLLHYSRYMQALVWPIEAEAQ